MNIHTLVDRFLTWPLPEGTCADPCACNPTYPSRTGTNLLNADQARQMLEHVLQPAQLQEPVRVDDFGKPISYDTSDIDAITLALTGDEGEDDSVTVLHSLVRYLGVVHPGKTMTQVLIETEEAMLAAAPQPTQQGWQPIESAPKDGTEILLFSKGDVGVCYWRDDKVMTGWTWGLCKVFRVPTHWMNLPAAPQQEAGNKLAAGIGAKFFDCGECPSITNGCAGRCIKGSTS